MRQGVLLFFAVPLPVIYLSADFLHNPAIIAILLIAIILFGAFFASKYAAGKLKQNYREFVSPIVEENRRGNQALIERIEHTEKALESFAGAMEEYARHMASHNRAIMGLSEASQALKVSAVEQNRILYRLSDTLEREKDVKEVSRVKRAVDELNKRTVFALQVRDELEHKQPGADATSSIEAAPGTVEAQQSEIPIQTTIKSPPGCIVKPRALYSEKHFSTN